MGSNDKQYLKIKLSDLQQITNGIFNAMQNEYNIHEILLKNDYYWEVDSEELFDITNDPSQPTVGSLYDDWEFLMPLLKEENRNFPLMFIHVAPLLIYLAYHVDLFEKKED